MSDEDRDLRLTGRAIALAAESFAAGGALFGALIADAQGRVIAEGRGSAGDPTAHAVINAVRALAAGGGVRGADAYVVAPPGATLFASGEPCVMCASALFRAGLRRVVYAGGAPPGHPPGLGWSCAEVLATASEPVELVGPLMQEEANGVCALFARHRPA
jgi:tRNA(Arg) A34 adenosine deaminase TadA